MKENPHWVEQRRPRGREVLLLLLGVLALVIALAITMDATAQTPVIGDVNGIPNGTRLERLPPDPCSVYPQPNYCAPRPWYELSYFIPREQQEQMLRQLAPVVLPAVLGYPLRSAASDPPQCFQSYGAEIFSIPCPPIDLRRATREVRRPVRRLKRRASAARGY